MRAFFIFVILVLFAVTIFIFGNLMRCASKAGDNCPGLCFQKIVDCSGSTSEICDQKKTCRAPGMDEYINILKKYFKELKYKL
jgi:hypothetical protein